MRQTEVQTAPDTFIEHYERKIHSQKQLIELSKALNSNLELHSLIDSILNISMAQSRTFQAAIYLFPEIDTHDFILNENIIGFEVNHPNRMVIPSKCELIKILYDHPTPLSLSEVSHILKARADEASKKAVSQLEKLDKNILLVPLKAKNRVNGLLVMGPKLEPEGYLSEEKIFLSDLASLAAIAVENARLYQLATVDMMTKLKIHHFFQTRLREEMESSRETGKSLALLLTDIDHFKKFNDTYGHQIGDLVLKEVARGLIQMARGDDVAARYGGEEFTLMLPGKNIEEAQNVAELYRKKIEKLEIENPSDKGERKLRVTVSIGVSVFRPTEDRENKDFIERCDQALYAAKHGGRNRVEIK